MALLGRGKMPRPPRTMFLRSALLGPYSELQWYAPQWAPLSSSASRRPRCGAPWPPPRGFAWPCRFAFRLRRPAPPVGCPASPVVRARLRPFAARACLGLRASAGPVALLPLPWGASAFGVCGLPAGVVGLVPLRRAAFRCPGRRSAPPLASGSPSASPAACRPCRLSSRGGACSRLRRVLCASGAAALGFGCFRAVPALGFLFRPCGASISSAPCGCLLDTARGRAVCRLFPCPSLDKKTIPADLPPARIAQNGNIFCSIMCISRKILPF